MSKIGRFVNMARTLIFWLVLYMEVIYNLEMDRERQGTLSWIPITYTPNL